MSRSRRKTPKCAHCTSGYNNGEKEDKQKANRKLRSKSKQLINKGIEPMLRLREVSNTWTMQKDGKGRFDPKENPDLMRK